ncbi:hypothetical protein FH972_022521 [Carpinus fangiana]|uniref:Uncharacterized protein n=1 Tax=Carpinus fangiana TaxID=176857 RepID=A0A5N6KSG5_9ROSI|nr:hypothetical protein FH972_022521 [Carpinus fangiana]
MAFCHNSDLLDYARASGLSSNFLLCTSDDIYKPSPISEHTLDFDSQIDCNPRFTTKERFLLTLGDVRFLKSLGNPHFSNNELFDTPAVSHRYFWKLEQPLLRTDHDIDLRQFIKDLQNQNEDVNFSSLMDDLDQDSCFPFHQRSIEGIGNTLLQSEKLLVSREDLGFLHAIINSSCTIEDLEHAYAESTQYKRNTQVEIMTPPLLPVTSPPSTKSVSSINDLPCRSACISPVEQQLHQAELEIFDLDRPTSGWISKGALELDMEDIDDFSNTAPQIGKRPENIKMEAPLTPEMELSGNSTSSVCDPDILLEPSLRRWNRGDRQSSDSEDIELDEIFRTIIEPEAFKTIKAIEEEQLHHDENDLRLPIPVLDSIEGSASRNLSTTKCLETTEIKEIRQWIVRMEMDHWSGADKIEQQLIWRPFPSQLAKFALHESGDKSPYLVEVEKSGYPDKVIEFESLTWKADGFRLLDHAELGDKELASATSKMSDDLTVLLRKRKFACMQAEGDEVASLPQVAEGHNHNLLFSASRALSHFLVLQGYQESPRKRSKASPSSTSPSEQNTHPPNPPPSTAALRSPVVPEMSSNTTFSSSPSSTPPSVSLPHSHQVVVSSAILRDHSLRPTVNALTSMLPSLELIERDYDNFVTWLCAKTTDIPQTANEDNGHADLTISPDYGILLTNLQKIKQQPLPSSSTNIRSLPPLRTRITRASHFHTHLTVLVTAAPGMHATPPDGRDRLAFAELAAFCAVLSDTGTDTSSDDEPRIVTAVLLPYDPVTVAAHIAALIAQCVAARVGLKTGPARLLHEETLWERFLRRTGLNAYAAQMVIAGARLNGLRGLSAFVAMGREQRAQAFSSAMGGRRVLDEDDVQHALHIAQHLLVGRGAAALKVRDDGRRRVALSRKILLRHGGSFVVLRVRARGLDRIADLCANGLGLDNVVGAVNLSQVLAFDGRTLLGSAGRFEANFFSVASTEPDRWAALSAALPRTTVSRGPAAPPRVLEPILVTESQSSDIVLDVVVVRAVRNCSEAEVWGGVAFHKVCAWVYFASELAWKDFIGSLEL